MSTDFLNRAFRFGEGRQMKARWKRVERVNALEPEIQALSDDELRARTDLLKERVDPDDPASLEEVLEEAFAVVREAGRRALGQRHYDVQLVGGLALHEGSISEMKTGEGKTLTSTLAVYVNALTGRGVHLVTVNDYLARRDAEWMAPIYDMLGITVGVIQPRCRSRSGAPPTTPTSRTGRTPSSASTTCATTWPCGSRTASSAATPSRSLTRWTR